MISEWLSLRKFLCAILFRDLPQSYLLRFPLHPFFSVTLASKSSSCTHFVRSSACSSLSPVVTVSAIVTQAGWDFQSAGTWAKCGPSKLELSLEVWILGWFQPVCSFSKRKHDISRVEADLLRKINISDCSYKTHKFCQSKFNVDRSSIRGAYVKTNVGSDWCVAFMGVTMVLTRLRDKLKSIFHSGFDWNTVG